jgi:hypothetical protein
MKSKTSALLFFALLISLAACSPAGGEEAVSMPATPAVDPPAEQPTDTPADLTEEMLKNMTFQGIYDEPVSLADGLYEGEPFVEGGASKPTVTLTPFIAFGDLDGDGMDDAAVLLVENSGGSGVFVYLAAVSNREGGPENVATTLLGDRVSPNSIAIEDGEAVLEVASHAEDDPMCCPSLKTRTTYGLQNGELTLVSSESLNESKALGSEETAVQFVDSV